MEFNSARTQVPAGLWNASGLGLLEIPAREFGAGREAGLGQDAPDVAFHRPLRQHERARDLAVGWGRARRARHDRRVVRYVEAPGGRLELIASFGDHTVTVTTTEAD